MRKCILFFLLLPVLAAAQKNYPKLLDNYMQAELKVKEYNGTVLVVQKGKTIYQKAFGQADKEWNIPNTSDTKFRIGSITKQFTAACILQLAENGKLGLEDKLSKYIKNYPKGDSVTIHMLLNHTSGIKNYTDLQAFWPKAILPLPLDSMIALFKNEPYDFSPGTQWNYSNSGYFLLGVIVEKASGKNFSDYLLENVIRKAGLKNTSMDRLDSILQLRAKGYSKSKSGWQHAQYISMEGPYSAGAMVSTVNDLHTWMQALVNNQIISAASVAKMTTAYKNNYGYGLGIDSLKNHRRISHSGGIPGFSSYLAYYPADDMYVVAISNNDGNSSGVGNSLASILFDLPVMIPYIPKEVKIDLSLLDRYTGKYMATSPIELIKKEGKLYRHREGAPDVELKPESNTRFFYADGSDRFIEFEKDKEGKVTKSWLITGGDKIEMKKL
ncbi:MAG: serine hydrolase [Bacteroidota bacterium]|nr:serine hydrolase [Bacteroidota bacterium]